VGKTLEEAETIQNLRNSLEDVVILNQVSKITGETANLQKRASISGSRGGHAKSEQDNGRRSVIKKNGGTIGGSGDLETSEDEARRTGYLDKTAAD
jgi:hypothetical protein